MSLREPQIILETDERSIVLEVGRDGKFVAKSGGWDENRFSRGRKLEVAVKPADRVLTHLPAGPRPDHGGIAVAVAIGPGGLDEAVDFGVGQDAP
jgi:hypothetical protein